MEIRWLEDFIALARTRHFSRAADEQNVTQPTFSRRIKLLEEEMKVTLVDRNSLPLTLTPAGKIFLQSAESITRELRETKARCLEIKDHNSSRLRLIATQELFLSFYPQHFLPSCQRLAIDIDVNMKSSAWGQTDFLNSMLRQESDLLLCFWHPGMSGLDELLADQCDYLTLAHESLVPCCLPTAQGAALYQLPSIKKKPLPYIRYEEGSFLADAVDYHLLRQHDIAQLDVVTSDFNAVGIAAMVKQGFGLGWLPESMVKKALDQSRLVIAGDKHWTIPMQIRLYKARNNPNPLLMAMWNNASKLIV